MLIQPKIWFAFRPEDKELEMEGVSEKERFADCNVEGKSFSSGYYRCKEGKCMSCVDGTWVESEAPHLVEKGHFEE